MNYIIKNIKSFIKNDKLIFVLVILCVFLSALIINFSYGLYHNYQTAKFNEESELTEIYIQFNNDKENNHYVTKKLLEECVLNFSKKTNDSVAMIYTSTIFDEFTTLDAEGKKIERKTQLRFTVRDNKITICEMFRDNITKENAVLVSGNYFTKKQDENGDNVALMPIIEGGIEEAFKEALKKVMPDENTIILQNKEYKVIGVQKITGGPIIPFNSLDDDTQMDFLDIAFNEPVTRAQYNDIKQTVEEHLGDLAIVPDLDIPELENYYLYNTIIIISVLMSLLSAINFAILYKYILMKRQKSLAVYRMCGCTQEKAVQIYLNECMLIAIPIFIIATIIYSSIILPLLSKNFEYIKSAYSLKLYLLIFVIYTLSSYIVLNIMIRMNIFKKSIVSLRKG